MKTIFFTAIVISSFFILHSAFAFEGHVTATFIRGGETQTLLYTAGTNELRIERVETNWPYAKDLVDLDTGDITLLFPGNRSFVHLKPAAENASTPPAFPQMPGGVSPGVGPPAAPAPNTLPNMPPPGVGMPAIPVMPRPMMTPIKLQDTGQKTNLLGYACEQYVIKQQGETMEIWATDQLFPFQPYLENQPPRFGPRRIEEQWGELLKAKKLFPLLASLKFDNGAERLHFEVKTITPEKIKDGNSLFQPPSDYNEIAPLPF